jgi:hypothetical protein
MIESLGWILGRFEKLLDYLLFDLFQFQARVPVGKDLDGSSCPCVHIANIADIE